MPVQPRLIIVCIAFPGICTQCRTEYRGIALIDGISSTRIVPYPGQDFRTRSIEHA
jgi:hypothetical protein